MTMTHIDPGVTGGSSSVQHVARGGDVDERVQRLRALAQQMTTDAFAFAEQLLREHATDLWQRARTPDGQHYPSEEGFWEDGLGIRRRTGFQCLKRGKTLAALRLQTEDRAALAAIGLHKFDVLAPVLIKEGTIDATRRWVARARARDRHALRDEVNQALGRTTRARSNTQRLHDYIVNAMPDLTSRELAEDFFTTGATYTETDNSIAIVVSGMQECLSTWTAHLPDEHDDAGRAGGDEHD